MTRERERRESRAYKFSCLKNVKEDTVKEVEEDEK